MLQDVRTRMLAALGLLLLLSATALGAPTVVLNEVAWGGTAAGGQDEWIELRNCTGQAIDLAGWVLTIGETRIPLSVAEESTVDVRRSTIEPNGYLLLERTDDTTVSDVAADIIYKGSLANSGADLSLVDAAGNVIDEVICAGVGWPAGCGSVGDLPYATMERVDPVELGAVWRTNDGLVVCGLDVAGSPIAGTPRAANSATIGYLKDPRVGILSPVAGDVTCPVSIQWQAVDPDGLASGLRITVSVRVADAENWTLLAEGIANQGTFVWDCSAFAKGEVYEVRVAATDWENRIGIATLSAFTLR
jgi:hypothetical protein